MSQAAVTLALANDAELIHDAATVEQAIAKMAKSMQRDLAGREPLFLVVMTGAMQFASRLLEHFEFPLQIDYLHVTRYRGATTGGQLDWIAYPHTDLVNRHVVVLDDILDVGLTMSAILEWCQGQGVASLRSAVLVTKDTGGDHAGVKPEYSGLKVPNRYVFGYGMDYQQYWRQLPAVYALND